MQLLLKSLDNPEQELRFAISDPEYCPDGAGCEVRLNGNVLFRSVIGVDPINAIENAITAIRAYLAGSRENIAWSDGSRYAGPP
ncbi:hypothetical protein [Pseudoduganella lutea]|uniref:Uncharacterized protein n=1 Tax=Pseudoduganella lutea TaxID=321985 RepID=A0A4P6KTH5_9BURK|nr:hypothetical protein [Pseudoduganella lutea]QBE62066.1 hypothetical protein EWM63_02930 [Pseudoduganella lutea]